MLTLAATCRILSLVNQRLVPFYPMKTAKSLLILLSYLALSALVIGAFILCVADFIVGGVL